MSKIFRRLAPALLLAAWVAQPVHAQFSITGFSPGHGAVNVPLSATFELTFSAPLDTSVVYAFNDYFLAADLQPETGGDPTGIELDPSRQVLSVSMDLAANTQYWLLIHGAQSTAGAELDRPYVYSFTTGSALPTGSIAGTVTFGGGSPTGTVMEAAVAQFLFGEDDEVAGGYAVADASGNYRIDYVRNDDFFVVGFQSAEPGGDIAPGQPAGIYDQDGDQIAEILSVSGSTMSGVDIALSLLPASKASDGLALATTAATSVYADAHEVGVLTGGVEPTGEAFGWAHMFQSPSSEMDMALMMVGGWAIPGPPQASEDPDLPALPAGWVDSDVVMATVEADGGADFRTENPDGEVAAFLLSGPFDLFAKNDEGRRPARQAERLVSSVREHVGNEAAHRVSSQMAAAIGAAWTIAYLGDESFLLYTVDAVSGAILAVSGRPETAATMLPFGVAEGEAWAANAELISVQNSGSVLGADGKSDSWMYSFVSATAAEMFSASVAGALTTWTEMNDPSFAPSIIPLPATWVDSDAAMAQAEAQADVVAFRGSFPDLWVWATLSRGLHHNDPNRALWFIQYQSQTSDDRVEVRIDASTGLPVNVASGQELPTESGLVEIYPNPTWGSAQVVLASRAESPRTVGLYDLLGRRVLEVDVPAGTDRLTLDGSGLPPGLYMLVLEPSRDRRAVPLVILR